MALNLYDTMTRQLRSVKPEDGQVLRFYCCGPTVYGPAHIGNFRTFVVQDIFRRVVEAGGLKTRHVRNITDVDDKTIRGAQAAGQTLKQFTQHWTEKFHADCAALGCLVPHHEPGAVDHIPQQLTMIEQLMAGGHAYQGADGSVYFKISTDEDYGRLSRVKERELKMGTSVTDDEYEKDTVADFALWKARKPEDGDNYWPSPWGEGRPGWHLECSAMSKEYLGDTFDLHSGGVDLIFPHHENEIAQSECCTGKLMCHHWFHITHLMVDGAKMSKSLNNLYTLDDLKEKGYSPAAVRYLLISGHYRQQLNFTLDALSGAQSALTKLAKFSAALETQAAGKLQPTASGPGPFSKAWAALEDDLNVPQALGQLFGAIGAVEVATLSPEQVQDWRSGLAFMLQALGLVLPSLDEPKIEVPAVVQDLAEKRWNARLNKDWAQADILRQELTAQGWAMKDGKETYTLTPL